MLSSQLDELSIWQILTQIEHEAPRAGVDADHVIGRLVFGAGSRLATSHGDPSLDGVYKLVAVDDHGAWIPAIKRSDSPAKVLNPGDKELWRIYDPRGVATVDVMTTGDQSLAVGTDLHLHHHARQDVSRVLPAAAWSDVEALGTEIVREGNIVVDGGIDALTDLGAARRPPRRRRGAARSRRATPGEPARVPRLDHRRAVHAETAGAGHSVIGAGTLTAESEDLL